MAKNKNTLSILCVKAEDSPVAAPFQVVQGKLILSNIAMIVSKQDHLGSPSQGLLRNIGWTLIGSCVCLLLSFFSLLTKGQHKS